MPDAARPVQITACPNGPLLVRGEIELRTADGQPIEQRRRTIALCRCGTSTIKPFCDGTHKLIHFVTDPEGEPGRATPADLVPKDEAR